MKQTITTILLFMSSSIFAQEIEVFPQGSINETEVYVEKDDLSGNTLAGKTVCRKTDVGAPTFTIYKAYKRKASSKTIVVCPGGAYHILSMDSEGSEICDLINKAGYDAVLLKYRVPRRKGREKHEAPLEDLQRTISMIRAKGKEYGINSTKVGVIGFSAGAHLAVTSCCNERIYASIDKVETFSCRPDFVALIYPAYLSGENFELASDITVTEKTPPTFIAQSEDDKNFINSSLFYYYALKNKGVPTTLHLYPNGGHGYGARNTGSVSASWPLRFIEWLKEI